VEESERLIRLVNDLLVLARADAGRALTKEPVDVSGVVEETCRQVHQLDPQRQLDLDVASDLKILGDKDALKQILLIVLDNAFKHSTGDIRVNAQQNNSSVEIRVKDFGQGIHPDKLERIFDRFYRGQDSTIPGFGLGLPIARSLVERQAGTIEMQSEPGKGSLLVIDFPSMR
jgi:signal transduction histidine kinase